MLLYNLIYEFEAGREMPEKNYKICISFKLEIITFHFLLNISIIFLVKDLSKSADILDDSYCISICHSVLISPFPNIDSFNLLDH